MLDWRFLIMLHSHDQADEDVRPGLFHQEMNPTKETINSAVVNCLRSIYDPEIPVNIYDLGLIYKIDVDDELNVICVRGAVPGPRGGIVYIKNTVKNK